MGRRMRSKKAIIISLSVVIVVVVLVLFVFRPLGRPPADRIAVVSLSGTITFQGASLFSDAAITPDLVRSYLSRAESDEAVKAIVIRVNSPGGTVTACQEILEEIERVREKIPVVAVMENMAASGGYYISTGADRIVASPVAMTGSIGVISQVVNVEGLYEKLGVSVQTFKGGRYKDMYSGLRELTQEEEEIMQRLVDEYYEHFVGVVAAGRGLSREETRELATGQLYTGAEAYRLGLVDELGGLDTALDVALGLAGLESAWVEYYRLPRRPVWSLLWFGDALRMRLWGFSAEDMMLLEILSQSYPQPRFLYQG
ncbi:MAG: signal peptide peptidase SppA [Dehalococcoidia bacterium]